MVSHLRNVIFFALFAAGILVGSSCQPPQRTDLVPTTRPPNLRAAAIPLFATTSWGNGGTIAIDYANTSGCASNKNSCLSTTCGSGNVGPCLNAFEVLNRWGTYEPIFNATTTVQLMSSQTTGQASSDPLALRPHLLGVQMIVQCTLTTVSTTTISALTAKNRATGTRLAVTLTAGGALGQLYTNTTHPSTSFPILANGGGFDMAQPLNWLNTLNTFPPSSEVDTWATTDSITLSTLPKVHITNLRPYLDVMTNTDTSLIIVKDCELIVPGNEDAGDSGVDVGFGVEFVDDIIDKETNIRGEVGLSTNNQVGSTNTIYVGGFLGGLSGQVGAQPITAQPGYYVILGGSIQHGPITPSPVFTGVWLDGDVDINKTNSGAPNIVFNGTNFAGLVEANGRMIVQTGTLDVRSLAAYSSNIIWSRLNLGQIDSGQGAIFYPAGAGAGAAAFLKGVRQGNASTCCLFLSAGIAPTCNNTSATGGNLDTLLGATTGCCCAGAVGCFCNTLL